MISVAVLRARLKLAVLAARDARLAGLIDGATATLGRELGRYLGTPAATHEAFTVRGSLVLLSDDPIGAVTLEERQYPTSAWAAVAADRFFVEGRQVRLLHYRHHPHPPHHWPYLVRAAYTRGYAVDAGPAELRGMVEEMAAAAWATSGYAGMSGERIGDYSYTVKDLAAAGDWPAVARRWRRGAML